MPTRKATATWKGGLKSGSGNYSGETGIEGGYTAGSRFSEDPGSNPEELLAAAHASCFSMAFAAELEKAGYAPTRIDTEAACTVERDGERFSITTMRLSTRASVPDLEEARLQEIAAGAKQGCPVSRALAGVQIEVVAHLE